MDDKTLYCGIEMMARKEYICDYCLYPIKKGEKYRRIKAFHLHFKTIKIFHEHILHFYCICGTISPTKKCPQCGCEEGVDYAFQEIKIEEESISKMLSVHIPISDKARKNDSRADIMYPPEIIQQAEREYKEAQCKS